jgi:hypothetical protein
VSWTILNWMLRVVNSLCASIVMLNGLSWLHSINLCWRTLFLKKLRAFSEFLLCSKRSKSMQIKLFPFPCNEQLESSCMHGNLCMLYEPKVLKWLMQPVKKISPRHFMQGFTWQWKFQCTIYKIAFGVTPITLRWNTITDISLAMIYFAIYISRMDLFTIKYHVPYKHFISQIQI